MSIKEKKVKIVLHVAGLEYQENDEIYGKNGFVFQQYSNFFLNEDVQLEYVSFAEKFLNGQNLQDFMSECASADIILIDCWNHPTNNMLWLHNRDFNAYESMAQIAEKLTSLNPEAKVFAQLMDGREQKVHNFAIPFNEIFDEIIINAIESAIKKVA
jgi:hypothetical protein